MDAFLAHTGMRPSQVKRLDADLDIRPYLDGEVPFAQVSAGKSGKSYLMPLTSDGKAAFLLFLRVGADLADAQAMLGHKSPKTTARYAEVSVDKLVTAVQRMERGWNEGRSRLDVIETSPARGHGSR